VVGKRIIVKLPVRAASVVASSSHPVRRIKISAWYGCLFVEITSTALLGETFPVLAVYVVVV
jgi:hypothetical protein